MEHHDQKDPKQEIKNKPIEFQIKYRKEQFASWFPLSQK